MFDELLSRHGLSLERLCSFSAMADAGNIACVAGGDPARQWSAPEIRSSCYERIYWCMGLVSLSCGA